MEYFYAIVPNPRYVVSFKSGVVDVATSKIVFNPRQTVTLELYGISITRPFIWFYLLAKYSVSLPYGYTAHIGDILIAEFPTTPNLRDKALIQTKKPLLYKGIYGLVLNKLFISNGDYAVSREGVVIDINTGIVIKRSRGSVRRSVGYEKFSFGRNHLKNVNVHRLVASVWIHNNDPTNKWVVNHVDGRRYNNSASNLEWVTPKDNTVHAVDTGLTHNNINVYIKKRGQSKVLTFPSVRRLAKFLGLAVYHRGLLISPRGKLWNDYEVRIAGDDRSWYYSSKDIPIRPTNHTKEYLVYEGGKLLEVFYKYTAVNDFLKFPNRTPIRDIKERIKDTRYTIEVVNISQDEPRYDAMNIDTGEIITTATIAGLAEKTGTLRANVALRIKSDARYTPFRGWVFRVSSNASWDVNLVNRELLDTRPKPVKVTNVLDSTTVVYDSINSASRALGITKKTIKTKLNKNVVYKNMLYQY